MLKASNQLTSLRSHQATFLGTDTAFFYLTIYYQPCKYQIFTPTVNLLF